MSLFVLFSASEKMDITAGVYPCIRIIKNKFIIEMKFFRIPNAEKLGNFILTVITAFVSTFLMQSCMNF